MDLLPHDNWRVTCNMHVGHRPGPEQWVMLNQWFKQYLAGVDQHIPSTPTSTFKIEKNTAHFTVAPAQQERLVDVEIYYSYRPNSITRFWKQAPTTKEAGTWEAELPVHAKLPLYTFALCRYSLPVEQPLERGSTKTFVVNSVEHTYIPEDIDLTAFDQLPKSGLIDDFSHGLTNWGTPRQGGSQTYKFQDPELDTSPGNRLAITLDLKPDQELLLRLDLNGKYNDPDKAIGTFQYERKLSGNGIHTILIEAKNFKQGRKRKGKISDDRPLEWSKITTFAITLTDTKTKRRINLVSPGGPGVLKRIELVNP